MRIKKKVGIGFGVVIVSFIVLIIISQIWMVSLTPEERLQLKEKREADSLQNDSDENIKVKSEPVPKTYPPNTIGGIPIEPGVFYRITKDGATKAEDDNQLDTKDVQTLVSGFESYNKTVRMLLDMCVNVESEDDFRFLMSLIAESGDEFLDNTSSYGAIKNKLMVEGYGEHPALGPLMDKSEILVYQMSTCMEILAWEFGG